MSVGGPLLTMFGKEKERLATLSETAKYDAFVRDATSLFAELNPETVNPKLAFEVLSGLAVNNSYLKGKLEKIKAPTFSDETVNKLILNLFSEVIRDRDMREQMIKSMYHTQRLELNQQEPANPGIDAVSNISDKMFQLNEVASSQLGYSEGGRIGLALFEIFNQLCIKLPISLAFGQSDSNKHESPKSDNVGDDLLKMGKLMPGATPSALKPRMGS